jgi:hypothetical protein
MEINMMMKCTITLYPEILNGIRSHFERAFRCILTLLLLNNKELNWIIIIIIIINLFINN